jgi:hypothetical protein
VSAEPVERALLERDLDGDAFDQVPDDLRMWRPAKTRDAFDDIRWMADTGETMTGVCRRLTALRGKPVSPQAVERFLCYFGRDGAAIIRRLKESGGDYVPAPSKPGGDNAGRADSWDPFVRLIRGGYVRGRRL